MAIEDAIIAQAQPYMLTAQIRSLIGLEISKGCTNELHPAPVKLEPAYCPLSSLAESKEGHPAGGILLDESFSPSQWQRRRVWISPDQRFDWNRSELFLKQISSISHRMTFEIAGNHEGIHVTFLLHLDDVPIIQTAFAGVFEECKLMPTQDSMMDTLSSVTNPSIHFRDYYPDPPYFHLLSTFEELKTSPFESLLCGLHEIQPPSIGFYQCVIQPVSKDHNWHRNVEMLTDLEYGVKLQSGFGQSQLLQQVPSGDLRAMAMDVERKAHNDKPFFCAAVRIGISGDSERSGFHLLSLSAFMNLFQHGGKPLRWLDSSHYGKRFSQPDCSKLIQYGQTHRPGFLLNSRELTGLLHLFPTSITEERQIKFDTLDNLPIKDEALRTGTVIGESRYGDTEELVRIPLAIRHCGTHIMSSSGMGKSTVMMNMFLQDIEEGKGAVFIDAHGDAIKNLLGLIPTEIVPRCIYFNAGDPEWIPSWNPLHIPPNTDAYRMCNDFLSAFKRISSDWGDRLASVLRNGLVGLSCLKDSTVLDLYNLTRQKSPESEDLRNRIIHSTSDDTVRAFWKWDFHKDYRPADLASPRHKLNPLIGGGESVRLMVSQPSSAINFRQIMDERKILLVDLSSLGSETREVLGSLILSLFLMATLSRCDLEQDQRESFSIFADEAHLFVSADAFENLITQARKFGVSLCVAHQYLQQFKSKQIGALSTTGAAIFGRMDERDSQHFSKDLQKLVKPDDLISLEPYEMIARIGTNVVRIRTVKNQRMPSKETRQRIIEQSRRQYYTPADEVRRVLAIRSKKLARQNNLPDPTAGEIPVKPEQLAYDEF